MPSRRPDRALRRAVTGFSRLHPEDLSMVLEALEPAEKSRIEPLIAEVGGGFGPLSAATPAPEPEPAWTWQGVSPWLHARIDPDAKTGRASREFILMTDAAREALALAAEPFRTPAQGGPGRGLIGLIRDRLAGLVA